MLCGLRGTAVDGEGIFGVVNGAPVFEGGFEGGFDFPVLDKVFDEGGEAGGWVVFLLCFAGAMWSEVYPTWKAGAV